MNQISVKLLSVLAIFLFIAIIPIAVLGTNENMSLVNTINSEGKQEFIIYIKDYTNQKFKYAFTNSANPEEMDLSYINSISDLGESQVAFLDAVTYEKLSEGNQPIFIWVKDENENLILKGIQLNLEKSLTKENINIVETLTKRIEVEIADSEESADATKPVRQENIDGVEETAKVGYVQIKDDKKAEYYYQRIKLSNSEEHNKLMALAEQIKNEYEQMDMYEKVQIGTEFNELYSKIISEANWQEVEKMTIEQPEESVAGDKYILLLKKVAKTGETTIDAQFLTAFDSYRPNVIKEEIVTQETTKLPITYDSIALFIILAVIIIALIVVFMRMRKLNQKDEQK